MDSDTEGTQSNKNNSEIQDSEQKISVNSIKAEDSENNKDITPTPSIVIKSKDKDVESLISQDERSDFGANSECLSIISASSTSDLKGLLAKAYSVISEKEKALDQAYKIKEGLLNENSELKALLGELQDNLSSKSYSSSINRSPSRGSVEIDDTGNEVVTPTRLRFSRRNTEIKPDIDGIYELEKINANLQSKIDELTKDKEALEKTEDKQTQILEDEILFYKKEFESSLLKVKELEDRNSELLQRMKRDSVIASNSNPVVRSNSQNIHQSRPLKFTDVPSPDKQYVFSQNDATPLLEELNIPEEEKNSTVYQLLDEVDKFQKLNRSLSAAKKKADDRIKGLEESLFKLQCYVKDIQKSIIHADQNAKLIEEQSKQIEELNAKLQAQRGGLLGQLLSSSRSTVSTISTNFSTTKRNKKGKAILMVHDDPRFNTGTVHKRAVSTSSINTATPLVKYTLMSGLESEFKRNFGTESNKDKQQSIINWVHENQPHNNEDKKGEYQVPISVPNDFDTSKIIEISNDLMSIDLNQSAFNGIQSNISEEDESEEVIEGEPNSLKIHAERGWFEDESVPLVPRRRPNNPVGIINIIRRCFGSIWKWCRFVTLLFAAVGMAVYRGPDTDVTEYYFD